MSFLSTDDLVMAVFRNGVEVFMAELASQHSGSGCLILGELGKIT